jgi:hypothetical protein
MEYKIVLSESDYLIASFMHPLDPGAMQRSGKGVGAFCYRLFCLNLPVLPERQQNAGVLLSGRFRSVPGVLSVLFLVVVQKALPEIYPGEL